MFKFLRNLWDTNQQELNKLKPLVERINALEAEMIPLSDEELRGKTVEFRKRIQNGETLDDLLPEAFAVVRKPPNVHLDSATMMSS